MMSVVMPQGPATAERPTLLFDGRYDSKEGPGASNYDVIPDGRGFVMIRSRESASRTQQINVVLNWFAELERLVPTGEFCAR
jgi:hypothetical protein